MIRFIVVQNRLGRTRWARWYVQYDGRERHRTELAVHRLLAARDSRCSNVVEFLSHKLVYKRFAGLYFVVGLDHGDSELGCLEFVQLLVETLDQFFGSVSELDLIFDFHRVYAVVDEMVVGGEIVECSKQAVLAALRRTGELHP